jgi:hypothetical protein
MATPFLIKRVKSFIMGGIIKEKENYFITVESQGYYGEIIRAYLIVH